MESVTLAPEARGHVKTIKIVVNERPVEVEGEHQTGASIKAAAIAQGVPIKPDFVLSIERGKGHTDIVGDDEPINVHAGERFIAVAPDDNS
jgi:hypothetical protein